MRSCYLREPSYTLKTFVPLQEVLKFKPPVRRFPETDRSEMALDDDNPFCAHRLCTEVFREYALFEHCMDKICSMRNCSDYQDEDVKYPDVEQQDKPKTAFDKLMDRQSSTAVRTSSKLPLILQVCSLEWGQSEAEVKRRLI
jgi:hypothetical protein